MSGENASSPLDIEPPVLLLGAAGMLGRAWHTLLTKGGVEHCCAGLDQVDLTRDESIERIACGPWRTYINCAAWTDVDGAETHHAEALAVNATGVRRLAEACEDQDALLVHYSTDYVFDGEAREPYSVTSPRDPQNSYGYSKLGGELGVEASGCRYLLVRTSWLYAPWGKNFVRTIAKAATEKPSLRVVNDQRGRPTSAEHLAGTTLRLIGAGADGVYHVTDGGDCTWYDFATEIARTVNPSCAVSPCTTAEFPRPAARPAYSVLDTSVTEALLGPLPHWKDNLADCLRRLEPL
jgi:dTDP-4-dehydrorhamnose reductase